MKLLLLAVILASFASVALCGPLPACSDFRIHTNVTELTRPKTSRFYYYGPNMEVLLFLASYGSEMYASFDTGRSWVLQIFPEGTTITELVLSSNRTFILARAADATLYVASFYEWDSSMRQLPWTRVTTTQPMSNFQPHPTDEDGLAALGTGPNLSKTLFYSSNFGRSWLSIRHAVFSFTWAAAGKYGLPANRLFVHENADSSGATNDWQINRLVYTTDLFASAPTTVFTGLTQFISVDDDLFLVRPRTEIGLNDNDLYISENGGSNWNKVSLPFSEVVQQLAFTILDAEDRSIFLSVAHENYVWGNLYAADSLSDKVFRLSLTDVPRKRNGAVEFSRIRGLYGFYMSNQYVEESDNPALPVRTVITFDEGAEWHPLQAPQDMTNSCRPNDVCQLNLLGPSASLGRSRGGFFSRPSAIGIVVGLGNVGPYLSSNASEIDTFVSRDGGKTFHLLRRGTHLFEIVNHGSLIVMIPDSTATNLLAFTPDEGEHTTECNFLSEASLGPVVVDAISVDPEGALPYALVEAHATGSDGKLHNYLIHIDLTRAQEYLCGGYATPQRADSDYELWIPSDHTDYTCILGRMVYYERKKRDRDCINPYAYKPQVVQQSCPCTLHDYSCDYCFERDFDTGKCILAPWCEGVVDPLRPPVPCTGYWTQSNGHTLLPGDYCNLNIGLDLRPREVICPPVDPNSIPISDPPIDKPDIHPHNPPLGLPPIPSFPPVHRPSPPTRPPTPPPTAPPTAPPVRSPSRPPVAAPKASPVPVPAPVRAPQTPPSGPAPTAVPLAASPHTSDEAPVWMPPPPMHRHLPPTHDPNAPVELTPDSSLNRGPIEHTATLAPAIIVIAVLASLLLLLLVSGGALWGLSGRSAGVRRFMMRFFSEENLPVFTHGDGENPYTALHMIDMKDEGVWDPTLLEEDADLIED